MNAITRLAWALLILPVVVCLVLVIVAYKTGPPPTFFDIKLVECFTTASPLFVALIIALVANRAVGNDKHRRDMVDKQIERFQQKAADILELTLTVEAKNPAAPNCRLSTSETSTSSDGVCASAKARAPRSASFP